MAGKGDKRRPKQTPNKKFDDEWERIFGNKNRGCAA